MSRLGARRRCWYVAGWLFPPLRKVYYRRSGGRWLWGLFTLLKDSEATP